MCQVLTLLFGAALVNWQNGFYTTWGSLLGTPEAANQAVPSASPGAASSEITYEGIPDFDALKAAWLDAGGKGSVIVPIMLSGRTTGYSPPANIYLPEAYFTDDGKNLYPVMEYFSGLPGNADQWLTGIGLKQLLDDAIKSHRIRPVIAVVPTTNGDPSVDSECLDIPKGRQDMTYLAKDVPWAVAQGLRAQPGGWIPVGFSSGGFCALTLAFQFPAQYRGAVSLSGYSTAYSEDSSTVLFSDEKAANQNNPYWLLENRAANSIPLFLGAASANPFDKEQLEKLLSVLPAYPAPTVSWVPGDAGGHNAETWAALMEQAWPWVEQQFAMSDDQSRRVPPPAETTSTPTSTGR